MTPPAVMTAAITGQWNNGRKSAPATLAAAAGSSVARARSASSGLAVGSAALAAPPASRPSGASLSVMT